jgi:integrase/recombinase XerD
MKIKALTENEFDKALDIATHFGKWGNRNRLLLLMTHMSGIRRGELTTLCIADVLKLNGQIKSDINLTTKRTIVLPNRLRQELKEYIAVQFKLGALAGAAYTFGHLPLFYSQKLNAFSPTTLSQTFTAIYKRAGLKGATTKTGRATWLNTLFARGANIKALQQLAGQTRIAQKQVAINRTLLRSVAEMI